MRQIWAWMFSGLLASLLAVSGRAAQGRNEPICEHCGKLLILQADPIEQSLWMPVVTDPLFGGLAPRAFCYAPGTDPAIVEHHSERFYGAGALNYFTEPRWSSTANGGTGGQGDGVTLTYSFVPDGVTVPDADPPFGFGNQPNTINAILTTNFGSVANGKAKFREVFDRWEELTGNTYTEVSDDGASLFGSAGVLGVRGDIRISACQMDGNGGVLAYNYYPNTGDMVLDEDEGWSASFNNYRYFRNVVAHEHGHGMGLEHVCPPDCQYLMEPFICTGYDGPQHDDIRGAQRHYGDALEPNDNVATAYDMGSPANGTTSINDVSNDDNSDTDWYKFTVPVNKTAAVHLNIIGQNYDQCSQTQSCTCDAGDTLNSFNDANLAVRLYDTNGTTILAEASSQAAGVDENIAATLLPAAGTYYVRVYADATNALQLYQLNLTIANGSSSTITVTNPNGGISWVSGAAQNITWTSSGVTGNVKIELNRNYPAGTWEVLFASTANDGTQSWTVTGPATTVARVRISSVNTPATLDISDNNFSIVVPTITVISPNGGESVNGELPTTIQWTTSNVTGNILIELNRTYPSASWQTVATVPNTTNTTVVFGSPGTTTARVRLTSVNEPTAKDTSNANFTIFIIDLPPVLSHDHHGDATPGNVTFVATATDDHSTPTVRLFKRVSGIGAYDSTAMAATGNPNEFAATVSLLDSRYDYFIRARDGINQAAATETLTVDIGLCDEEIISDDGSAEGYNWAEDIDFAWAVRVVPESYPFLLCGMKAAISRITPDAEHTTLLFRVLNSDGPLGLPGTELWSELSGSIGNVPGGLPAGPVYWTTALIEDTPNEPLSLSAPFYLVISNPEQGKLEAFGRDDNTPNMGNSFFFDGCDMQWYNENDAQPNAQGGTRLIRPIGFALGAPSDVTIYPVGNDLELRWSGTGAPYYQVYSSTTSGGPFVTLVGSTTGTTFTHVGGWAVDEKKFYVVVSSTTP